MGRLSAHRYSGTFNCCLAAVGYFVILTLHELEKIERMLDGRLNSSSANPWVCAVFVDLPERSGATINVTEFFSDISTDEFLNKLKSSKLEYKNMPVLNQLSIIVEKWKKDHDKTFTFNNLKLALLSTFCEPDQISHLRDAFRVLVEDGMVGFDGPSQFLKPDFAKGALIVSTNPDEAAESREAAMKLLHNAKNGHFFFFRRLK